MISILCMIERKVQQVEEWGEASVAGAQRGGGRENGNSEALTEPEFPPSPAKWGAALVRPCMERAQVMCYVDQMGLGTIQEH